MFDEVNKAVEEYQVKWRALIAARRNKEFFERLKPTALGWKVADLSDYNRLCTEWREACHQIFESRLNDRWIATMHLKDGALPSGIEIVELMQRRPDSSDAIGLDHLDFYDTEIVNTLAVLGEEAGLVWAEEENDKSKWVSIRFDGSEAKLRAGTVLDIVMLQIQGMNQKLLASQGIVV